MRKVISNELPIEACDLACYKEETVAGVSVWFLNTVDKTMMVARSTNIEGYLLKAKRIVFDNSNDRIGPRMKLFLQNIHKKCDTVYWVKNGFGTEQSLVAAGWTIVSHYASSLDLPSRKVMITGKVLKVEHLKSHFTFYCAVEPGDLRKMMHQRLVRACDAVRNQPWCNPTEVGCFLERFTKQLINNKDTTRQFATKLVKIKPPMSHMAYVRCQNTLDTAAWLERKGFKQRHSLLPKESNDSFAKDSST